MWYLFVYNHRHVEMSQSNPSQSCNASMQEGGGGGGGEFVGVYGISPSSWPLLIWYYHFWILFHFTFSSAGEFNSCWRILFSDSSSDLFSGMVSTDKPSIPTCTKNIHNMLWQLFVVLTRSSQASQWIPLTEVGNTVSWKFLLLLTNDGYKYHHFKETVRTSKIVWIMFYESADR